MTTKNEEAKQWMAERIKARQQKKKGITFSVTQYQDMKADGMSDAKIVAKYNSNVAILNAWKKEHNLIGKHNLKTIQREQGETVESEMDTKQPNEDKPVSVDYEKFCATKDKEIARLNTVNERQLTDNKSLAEENERLHKKLQEPLDDAIVDGLKVEIEELEEELHKWKSDHSVQSKIYQETLEGAAKLQDRIDKMQIELDIRSSEYALLENQLNNATERIQKLKKYESDYRSLEIDYRNLHNEHGRMERMLERLKHTEQINVWLMEQHVAFHAQLDEVMG